MSDKGPLQTILYWLGDSMTHYIECCDSEIEGFIPRLTELIELVNARLKELQDDQ